MEGSLIRSHLLLIKWGGVAITTRVQGVWPPSQALISLENKNRHVGMYALTRFAKQEPAREEKIALGHDTPLIALLGPVRSSAFMPPWSVHLDPNPGTCGSPGRQDLEAPLGRDPRLEDCYHLLLFHSCPPWMHSVPRPLETCSACPGQPCRSLPAGR